MPTEKTVAPAPTWDLESVFKGGSRSQELQAFRDQTQKNLLNLRKEMETLPEKLDATSGKRWTTFILGLQDVGERIELIRSFGHCLVSQNVSDTPAQAIESEGDLLWSEQEKMFTAFSSWALKQTDDAWKTWMSTPELKPIEFLLSERRDLARAKMPQAQEELALDLGVNGYDAWGRIYTKIAGDLRVTFEDKGDKRELSLGQLVSKMSNPDRTVRKRAFDGMEGAWQTQAPVTAMTLNSLAGFRLSLYKNRKWDSHLYEALKLARLSEESLDAMWRVVSRLKTGLAPFIEAKKKLLKIDRYSWWDEVAPVGASGRVWPFEEAVEFIVKQTATFSDDLSRFCKMAIERRWVEAENRPNKVGGAYCTSMGHKRESRVFMTFSNTYDNLLTLAHELGHAYHSHVLREDAYFATLYPMTLAETASIFTETLVTDAALGAAENPAERLFLMNQKLQEAYVMYCNLHARFLFESNFYTERRKGVVPKERLDELMVSAQKEAYAGMLDPSGVHPLFWTSKLHFHLSDVPFYNFPYVFGFLFASGVYARAKKEGKGFAAKYAALLKDTGRMSSEDVARKHLDVDLSKDDFWAESVERSLKPVGDFVKLAREVG